MPTLQLLRHAKSAWPPVADHLRPLNERGERDAPAAGRVLANRGRIGLAVVSPATRTRMTFDAVVGELTEEPWVRYDERIYEASVNSLLEVLSDIRDDVAQALLVGHNPGVEMLAARLVADDGSAEYQGMTTKYPTSGLAQIELPVPWSQVGEAVRSANAPIGTLTSFVVPRG